jgi:hypothetical protein
MLGCHTHEPPPDGNVEEYDPRNISRTETDSYGPTVAVGPDGTVYVAWMDGGHGEYEDSHIYFKHKEPGGEWSDIEVLSDTTVDSWAPQMVCDPYGNVHLVWEDHSDTTGVDPNHEIFYRMRRSDGGWTETENISGTPYTSVQARIAVDSMGVVHVVWGEGFGLKYRSKSGGSWGGIEVVPVGVEGAVNPEICADFEGGLHVVYEDGKNDIKYLYRSPSGQWSEPVNVSRSSSISIYCSVSRYDVKDVLISWVEMNGDFDIGRAITYYVIKSDEGFSDIDSLPFRGEVSHSRFLRFGSHFYGFFIEAILGGGINVYQKTQSGWRFMEKVSSEGYGGWPPYTYDVACDGNGRVHLVWSQQVGGDFDSNAEIFYEVIEP